MSTYDTPFYDRAISLVEQHIGACLPARGMFVSNEHWLKTWPGVLRGLSSVAFFVDEEGFVGRGVHKEVHDAHNKGLPVWFVPRDGSAPTKVHPQVLVVWKGGESWRQYARIAQGEKA